MEFLLTEIPPNVTRIELFKGSSYTNQVSAENTNIFSRGFVSGVHNVPWRTSALAAAGQSEQLTHLVDAKAEVNTRPHCYIEADGVPAFPDSSFNNYSFSLEWGKGRTCLIVVHACMHACVSVCMCV